MAIERITTPDSTLTDQTDWQAALTRQEAVGLRFNEVNPVSGGNVVKGAIFQIGAVWYKATSDTAITGTASDYVKITPAGSVATASYVADLAGVSWNDTYNGWYDGGGALYVFDEAFAKDAGEITDYKSSMTDIQTYLRNNDYATLSTNKAVTDSITTYPRGLSYHMLGAGSTGWPDEFGSVLTLRIMDARAIQIFQQNAGARMWARTVDGASAWRAFREVWNAETDGSGSGLDADLLDGLHGSEYVNMTEYQTIAVGKNFTRNITFSGGILSQSLTNLGGPLLPMSSPTTGSQVIAGSGGEYTPSRGLYNSSWGSNRGQLIAVSNEGGGDGPYSGTASTKVLNTSSSSKTWYYAQF